LLQANAQGSLRELYYAVMRRLCKEWAHDIALAAAAAAPCLLLLPADMDCMLALCTAINDLYLPHFGVEVKHVYIGQALRSCSAQSEQLQLSEPQLSEPQLSEPQLSEPQSSEPQLQEPRSVETQDPVREHKTRSARAKKRRYAFWRFCAPKK